MLKRIDQLLLKAGIYLPAFLLSLFSHSQQIAIKNYSVEDGLPQSQVFGLYQDNQGYIWMGTKGGGIVRFDGKKFTALTDDSRIAFVNRFRPAFGKVFIAHTSGISIYDETTRKITHPDNGINKRREPVSEIIPFTNDSILVATIKGVYIGTPNNLIKLPFEVRESDQVPNCGIVHDGKFYLGNNYGLHVISYRNGQYDHRLFSRKQGLISAAVRCVTVYKDKILVGTYGGGIMEFTGTGFTRNYKELSNELVTQYFYTDKKNNLWIATSNRGVIQFNPDNGNLISISESEGLCRNNIVSILEDDWGNTWFGSSGGGVSRYNGQLFVHYTNKNGLEGKNVYACYQTPDSAIWLGSSAPGITCIKSGEIRQFNSTTGFTDAKVKNLYYSTYHQLLFIATEGDGIWIYRNDEFEPVNKMNEHAGLWIKHFYEDEKHRIFVSTASKGLICFDAQLNQLYSIDKSNFLKANRVNYSTAFNGQIWIATEGNGLVRYDEKTNVAVTLTVKNKIPSNTLRTVLKDNRDRIWIGSPSGIGYFNPDDPDKFNRVRLPKGYNNAYLLFADQNYLYCGSAQGLSRIALNELSRIKQFGANEGFTGLECSQNAVAKGLNQSVLFGTINGFTIMRTAFEQQNSLAPILNFTEINLFYDDLLQGSGIKEHNEFIYTQNHLGFKFTGINQLNPDGVKYQWKLKGLEEKWSPLTATNEVNYTNLDPGEYEFMVRAVNENGIWTKKPLTYSFYITRPWFKQTWFYIICVATAIIILLSTYLLINRRARKIQERKNKQLTLENQLLEIQQMALRLQMNPHFIFNCLNSIQNLVSQNRNDDANFYIQKFSGLMRGMVDLTPKDTIRLDEELKLLTSYMELEKLNRSNSFSFTIRTNLSDAVDFYRIPPLLIQPFAENAIVHGFKGISYEGTIDITITDKQNMIQIEISDNGKGMDEDFQLPADRNSAIKITNQRLDLFNRYKHQWVEIIRPENGNGLTIRLSVLSN